MIRASLRQTASLSRATLYSTSSASPTLRARVQIRPEIRLALRYFSVPTVRHHASKSSSNLSMTSTPRYLSTSTANNMPPVAGGLGNIISGDLLAAVNNFWFSHIPDQDATVLPQQEQMQPWFGGGEEFDNGCVKRFAEPLEAIRSLAPSPSSVLSTMENASPTEWLAAVLLLDQVPRNCYRGTDAHVVFNLFDPLAQAVARHAIELGIPTSSDMKYFGSRRMWFYLPLMHSEQLEAHDQAVAEYTKMAADFKALLGQPSSAAREQDRQCGEVLARNKEAAEKFLQNNLEFELRHRDIIAKFGRYPHRNGPLGREMEPKEQEYLDNGGDTFAAAA